MRLAPPAAPSHSSTLFTTFARPGFDLVEVRRITAHPKSALQADWHSQPGLHIREASSTAASRGPGQWSHVGSLGPAVEHLRDLDRVEHGGLRQCRESQCFSSFICIFSHQLHPITGKRTTAWACVFIDAQRQRSQSEPNTTPKSTLHQATGTRNRDPSSPERMNTHEASHRPGGPEHLEPSGALCSPFSEGASPCSSITSGHATIQTMQRSRCPLRCTVVQLKGRVSAY
jgi:hypothetical protein